MAHTPLKDYIYIMPKPMGNDNYNNIANTVRDATKVVTGQKHGRCSKRSEAIMKSLIPQCRLMAPGKREGSYPL